MTDEMVPAWLEFLQLRCLLSPEAGQETMKELEPMKADLLKLWETMRTPDAASTLRIPGSVRARRINWTSGPWPVPSSLQTVG
jgi:hypothetical protein